MKIAYLLNSYPMTSTTFIRREIDALVAAGVDVQRYAARRWTGTLVDPLDIAEQRRTHYMLSGNVANLVLDFFKELSGNPIGVGRAVGSAWILFRNAHGGIGRHVAYLLQASHFKRLALKANIAHVHAHFATNATSIALLSHRMGGPGYSFTAHGPDEFDNTALLSFDFKIRHARFVAAISNFCRVQLLRATRWEYWEKISIVRCGLAVDDFQPGYAFAEDNQTFVNVARFSPQKGLLMIPPAVALLKKDFPALKVVLIGDGEERALLEAAIADNGVAGMIELRGWQPNDAVRHALATSRALLLPSFAEGLPVVIMESFALGRPVIATYIAGIPELVDESCGWLVPASDIDSLAKAMREALNTGPQKLREMGNEGRRRSVSQHNVLVSANQLQQLFHKACEAGTTSIAAAASAKSLRQPGAG